MKIKNKHPYKIGDLVEICCYRSGAEPSRSWHERGLRGSMTRGKVYKDGCGGYNVWRLAVIVEINDGIMGTGARDYFKIHDLLLSKRYVYYMNGPDMENVRLVP